jgi:D-amino-acid oxidase
MSTIAETFSSISEEIETREINPPKLDADHLGPKILCHRPMREGAPNMSVERSGEQIIAHNYGHGGSGWTLGPAAARHVIDLLEAEIGMYSKDIPITVIGAGTIGLFSTLELQGRGYSNITVVADSFTELTSHRAGGLLAHSVMNNTPEIKSLIDQLSIEAYQFYRTIAEEKHPILKKGTSIISFYCQNRGDSLELYVGKGMQSAKEVVLNFKNGTSRTMVAYDGAIFMNVAVLMNSLRTSLEERQVTFIQKHIADVKEIQTPIIVNCTGLGARELVHDEKMISVQGHLMMLKDQDPNDINYMVGFTHDLKDKTRSFYLMPKSLEGAGLRDIGVIGGTFIKGAGPENPNLEEFDLLVERAKKFYGI